MNGIKYLLVFGLGAIAGSILAAKYFNEKYSKIADEEIESVKRVTKKTVDELKKQISNWQEVKVSEEKINGPLPKITGKISNNIEILSEESYFDSDNDKMTIYFYGEDKTALNEHEEIIDDILRYIGKDIINNPKKFFSSDSVLYVRNTDMNLDFEVLYYDKSYSKDALNLNA